MTAFQDVFRLQKLRCSSFCEPASSEFYSILLLEGSGEVSLDFTEYAFDGKIALFTSPYQHLSIRGNTDFEVERLSFHGDFYCIEYHKNEVACNGLLFNNLYSQPFIPLKDNELDQVFEQLREEIRRNQAYSEPVLRTYLQLLLALSSRIKRLEQLDTDARGHSLEKFRALLEHHFLTQRNITFYARELALSPGTFARKCRQCFGKSPSQLLQERLVLEAKKQLHLTHKSVKEVAAALHFDDEHYFSRFFKKHTGVSPTLFREKVGISVVADLSMR
ncbi:helix-turn-helix domain-containing protein [Pontibacter litorisediminis]|uniref:helix-turn-helix domain-containing protein n=1 Tax=Pontibacter litorisediminis TaxID=1846260 RepID=UPI0023EDCE3D|nr:AraC family transcriptional regulator [Pontibacter litorisediminis]